MMNQLSLPEKRCFLFFRFFGRLLIFALVVLTAGNGMTAPHQNMVRQIRLQNAPQRIYLKLSRRSPYKIIHVDKKEIVIALKNVGISDSIERRGTASSFIQNLRIEHLQNNVTLLVLETVTEMIRADAAWEGSSSTLVVNFHVPQTKTHKIKKRLKQKPARMPAIYQDLPVRKMPEQKIVEETIAEAPTPLSEGPPSDQEGGSIDDILDEISKSRCASRPILKKALADLRSQDWSQAETGLIEFLKTAADESCQAPGYFLKAYCQVKQIQSDNEDNVLGAIAVCQDAVNFFPDSPLLPYGMTMLAKLYLLVNNEAEATGYFKLVQEKYPLYRGIPEIIYELGVQDEKKSNHRNAVEKFEKLLARYPRSIFVSDTRLALGKTLYKMNSFSKAIEQLEQLINDDPKKIYEASEALLYMGNSYYHIGKFEEARTVLEKAYNLYPENDSSHIVLTRIADALADEKKDKKARELYELVIEKYPGSDGFVISSIRLAQYLDTREEKEKIYRLIIEDYPDNPMANLARLRIAEIQNKAGEFRQSIDTINELFLENPRALNKEALFLKQDSFESYFKWMIENGNYPEVLSMYEKDRQSLDTYENPSLFTLVGESYFQGHLYESAARLLEEADNYTKDNQKPDKHTYMLGVALQESGDSEKSASYLTRYIKANPQGEYTADAYRRMARIENLKNQYAKATTHFKTALAKSGRDREKAEILIEYAGMLQKQEQYPESSSLLTRSINILSTLPETEKPMMLSAYRELGKSYMLTNNFLKASDAFAMALKYTETDEDRIGLNFLLGESYSRDGHPDAASQAYEVVVSLGDGFWSKLATEKLKNLKLAEKMKKT